MGFIKIWEKVSKGDIARVNGTLPCEVADYILNRKRNELADLEKKYGVSIMLNSDPSLPPGGGKLDFLKEDNPGS